MKNEMKEASNKNGHSHNGHLASEKPKLDKPLSKMTTAEELLTMAFAIREKTVKKGSLSNNGKRHF